MKRIVDNRVLLLGIDQRYREGMALLEAKVLLAFAEAVAARLGVVEADVPVEGYYAESGIAELPRYFRLMRALQQEPESAEASDMPELQRLQELAGSAMYGRAQWEAGGVRRLLPTGRDSLSEALNGLAPADWSVGSLLGAAHAAAIRQDDISLVGLAARAGDAAVLAALRESVILYAEKSLVIGSDEGPRPEYVWRVDAEVERCANRFIDLFNRLVAAPNATVPARERLNDPFGFHAAEPIPRAAAESAARFYSYAEDNAILGRCAHLGTRRDTGEKYHWAVRGSASAAIGGGLEVHDFWSPDLWTTSRYRSVHNPAWPRRGAGDPGHEIV